MSSSGYWQTGCLWWEAVESWLHLVLKSFFAFKNDLMGFLVWSHYSMDKCNIWIADEIDMTPLPSSLFMRKVSTTDSKWESPSHVINLYTMEQLAWCTWMSCSYWKYRHGSTKNIFSPHNLIWITCSPKQLFTIQHGVNTWDTFNEKIFFILSRVKKVMPHAGNIGSIPTRIWLTMTFTGPVRQGTVSLSLNVPFARKLGKNYR